MTISIAGDPPSPILLELRTDVVPQTCKNFLSICSARSRTLRRQPSTEPTYKGIDFHRIKPGFVVQGGDYENFDGSGGRCHSSVASSFGSKHFHDENFTLKHDGPGVLSMANSGPNTNGSQFFITLQAVPHLDGKHVVFGRVVRGMEVIKQMEKVETDDRDRPELLQRVVVIDCGVGKGPYKSSEDNSSAQMIGKRKTESLERRSKRRRKDKKCKKDQRRRKRKRHDYSSSSSESSSDSFDKSLSCERIASDNGSRKKESFDRRSKRSRKDKKCKKDERRRKRKRHDYSSSSSMSSSDSFDQSLSIVSDNDSRKKGSFERRSKRDRKDKKRKKHERRRKRKRHDYSSSSSKSSSDSFDHPLTGGSVMANYDLEARKNRRICKIKKRYKRRERTSSGDKNRPEKAKERAKVENNNRVVVKDDDKNLEKVKLPSNQGIANAKIISNKQSDTFSDYESARPKKRNCMAPMTKEAYDVQQSVVREVYDPSTGRTRLIRGSGEVIEKIVRKDEHFQINKMATFGDGMSFSRDLASVRKKQRR